MVGLAELAAVRAPPPSDFSTRARPASTSAGVASTTTTSRPLRAHTSAMPEPISPQPSTPTRSISVPFIRHNTLTSNQMKVGRQSI